MVDERPDRIGPYLIESTLGGGGMGVVYRATGPDGEKVAVKTLRQFTSAAAVKRFMREADIRIEHPNVIRTLDAGSDGQRPYIALELLEGESLDLRIERGTLAPADAVRIVIDVCAGLAAAHELGIVHRDLKPANVFVGTDGQTKVLDFGIAGVRGAARLTEVGQVLGTVAYLSPEQARGGAEITVQADVWACGLLIFEAISGILPFERDSLMTTILAVIQDEAQPLHQLVPSTGEALSAVVQRCFVKDAEGRWPGVAALRSELLALGPLDTQAGDVPASILRGTDATIAVTSSSLRPDEQRVVVVLLARGIEDPSWVAGVIERAGGEAVPFLGTGVLGLFGSERWEGHEMAEAVDTALAIKPYAAAVAVASGRALGGLEGISGRAIRVAEEGLRRGNEHVVVDRQSAIALDGFATTPLDEEYIEVVGARPESELPDPLDTALLIGREIELFAIRSHVDAAIEASAPACIICSGPMGIGKSALRRAVEASVAASVPGVVFLQATGGRSRKKQPLSTIASALYRHFAGRNAELQATAVTSRISDLLGGMAAADCSTFLGELLGLEMPETISLRAARRDPQLMSDLTRMALEDYLSALISRGPVVLRIENAQLSDQVTLQLVERLLAGNGPLVVYVVTRDPEIALGGDRANRIALGPLKADAAGALVRKAAERSLDDALVGRIVERAGGNPLFLEQTVLALADSPDADIPLPVTVEAAVQTRLDGLPEELRELCKQLSVLDSEVLGAQLLGLFGAEAAQLQELVGLGIVRARTTEGATDARYTLAGDLLSQVAYRMLPEERLQKLHSHIAQHLASEARIAPELVASHYERGGEPREAARWYLRAAMAANAAGDSSGAAEHAARAEQLGVPEEHRYELAMVRADAAQFLGERDEQGAALERAMDLAESPKQHARVLSEYVALLSRTGRSREAVIHARSALRAADNASDTELMAKTNAWQASGLMLQGHFDEAQACLDAATDQAERGLPSTRAFVAQCRATLASLRGDVGAALLEWQAVSDGHHESHDARRAAASSANLADAYNRLGAYDLAEASLAGALESARRVGYPEVERYARLNLAYSRLLLGQDPSALLDQVDVLAQASADERVGVFVALYRARTLLAKGSFSEARDAAAAAGQRARKGAHDSPALLATILEARACLELGEVDSALELTKAALAERDSRGGLEEDEAEVFLARADALRAAGSENEAAEVEARGAARLREVARKIADEAWRARFLESVQANRDLLARVAPAK